MNDGVNKYTHVDCPWHQDYIQNMSDVMIVHSIHQLSPTVLMALDSMKKPLLDIIAFDEAMWWGSTPNDMDAFVLERFDDALLPEIQVQPKQKNKPYYRQLSGWKKKTNNKY